MSYLALARVEFDYEAQTEEELSVSEDQLVWVLEDEDPEWFKVKLKVADSSGPSGLVPASYLAPPTVLRRVTALYEYVPARNDAGDLENEEEIDVAEGEELLLWESEGDWVLVGRESTKGVGFVPASYVESTLEEEEAQEPSPEPEPAPVPVPVPAVAYVAPAERVAASNGAPKAGDVKTWSVSEVDSKKKKKKGTLGVGNGAVFFASESDKTPVQQYQLSTLIELTSEKSKHLHLTFPSSVALHFVISSKDAFEEIVAKIEDGRSSPAAKAPVASARFVPPPPPLLSPVRSAPPAFMPAAPSPVLSSGNGDAVALYDFEAQGEDELNMVEGDRLVVIVGGSDDSDWIKCRKVGSMEEGVVPASYVQPDEGDEDQETEDDRRHAEEEADADAADALALQYQIQSDQRAISDRRSAASSKAQSDREVRDVQRRKDAVAEVARQKRISQAPPAAPLALPQPGDGPPRIAARPSTSQVRGSDRERSSTNKKPSANRVRTWKDRTGQFKVEAEFLGLNGNKIRLHKLNGVIIEVPVEKMSAEDTAYLKKVTTRQNSADDDTPLSHIADRETRRDERHRRGQTAAAGVAQPRPSLRSSQPVKKSTDWFEFFLAAGCDVDDCTRYATNFARDRIDEDLLVDLEQSTMRSLGLREGDIIRVNKHIRDKYHPPPTPDKSDRDAQIAADAAMARSMSIPSPAPPALFTSASGGLKTTRRGRPPTSRQASSAVDSASIATASSELTKRGTSPPTVRIASPPVMAAAALDTRRRANSAVTSISGFDDDAWTVKPPSQPSTPAPVVVVAPPPPVAAPVIPAPAIERAASTGPTLSYNDGLLAQMGIGPRTPSAPALSPYATPPNGYSPAHSPALPLGPRGPVAPVYANQPLLNPLIPTQTGMSSFVPTRQPLMPTMTGYPMQQGMGGYGMMPQMAGMQSPMLSMQPTGYQPQLQPQPTGYQPQMQLQPQATGMYNQSFGAQPPRFSPGAGPIQFNPMPPKQVATPPPASTTAQYQPSNVFASMKPGGFPSGTGPQEPTRYDALRSQPTGMSPGLQPQSTGFMQPQQTGYGLQSQPTGFGMYQQQQPQQQQQQNGYGRQY